MPKEHVDEYEPLLIKGKDSKRLRFPNKSLLLAVFASCVGGTFQYGYNISVINAPTRYVQRFINTTWMERYQTNISEDLLTLLWSTIVSMFTLGGLIGVSIGGTLSVKLGRKGTLLTNNAFALTAALLMGLSSTAGLFELLIVGRFLSGINAGIAICVQPLYLGEIAPTSLRGAMGMGTSVFITGGILTGQIMGLKELLGTEDYWPILLSTTFIPAVLQLLILPWFPESPRYLLIDKGDDEGCKKALRQLYGSAHCDGALEDIERERNNLEGFQAKKPWELFADRSLRWQLLTIILLNTAQQLNGINAIYFYADYVFKQSGIPVDKIPYATVGTGACECITALTCGMLIECLGRKVLITGGYILMSICCILFTLTLTFQNASPVFPYLSMACVFAFILSFGLGPGGVTNILTTELFTQTSRPAAFIIAGSVNWLSFFFIGLVFPFIVIGLQQYCFLVFLAVSSLVATYIFFVVPETKNKTFVEIQNEFQSSKKRKYFSSDGAGTILLSSNLLPGRACACTEDSLRAKFERNRRGEMPKERVDEYEPLLIKAGKDTKQSKFPNKSLLLAMFGTCIGGTFQCGYNISVINAPTEFVQNFINRTWIERYQTGISQDVLTLLWSTIVSIFTLGGFVAVSIGGTLSVKLGRRGTLLTNNLFSITAALLMGLSSILGLFELLIIGRLLVGINAGIALCVEPMFLGEIAPTALRGAMGMGTSIFLTVGILSGQVMGLREVLGREEQWPILLSTTCVPAFLQLLILPWFPESPRYLLIDKGDEEGCKKALKQLHGSAACDDALEDIQREKSNLVGFKAKKPWELIADRSVRWQLLTIILLNAAQQLNGVNAMYFYADYVFRQSGIPTEKIPYATVGTGACECITALTCGFLVECLGRRVLIAGGYILMSICCVLFTLTLTLQNVSPVFPYLTVACVFAFVLSFGLGPGGVTNILTTELFTQTARPAAFMIAGSVNWLSFFLIGLVFPFIVIGLQQYCFLVFFVVCSSVAIYILLVLPETKNKSFLEIHNEFQSKKKKDRSSDGAGTTLISTCL
ncbi:uncharacterized protein ACNS7B_011753 [Menidia menidia]